MFPYKFVSLYKKQALHTFYYVIRESFILHYVPQLTSRHSIKRLLVVYKQYISLQIEFSPFLNKILHYKLAFTARDIVRSKYSRCEFQFVFLLISVRYCRGDLMLF
jgi:hypothetical protein